ncbi:hypothetical protein GQ43DRAFT_430874 [Delitschia confertaspora ATCC 74209]|uniref:Uncharacterized protein n=1 Tax=Delitschia confertaspora ATCC 74209 TaxID=1513339 RepID=A0A9P4JNG8_9PLEO|nr:hypothetical protein GQ43DRAFT_430874 [Delitschia confertaspora ATCC 74209]
MTSGSSTAYFVRSSEAILNRFRSLHQAEYIILFTPVVPHPAGTELRLDMDPFEPLGRSLSRRHSRIRHVPYVPSRGLTQTHLDFLRSAGSVIMVVCAMEYLSSQDMYGYSDQTQFAQDITRQIEQDRSLVSVPILLLLITNSQGNLLHQDGVKDFPAVISCTDYTPAALEEVARVMFGG